MLGDFHRELLGAAVQGGEVVAIVREKLLHGPHRIGGATLRRRRTQAPVGQDLLFARIGPVQPQDRLGHARERGGEIGDLERGQVDPLQQGIAHHLGDPLGVVVGILGGELGHVELVSPREPDQQLGGDRPLVAFEQGDVAGRDVQVRRHGLLGQAQFAAQAAQAGAKVEGAGLAHEGLVRRLWLTPAQHIAVKLYGSIQLYKE